MSWGSFFAGNGKNQISILMYIYEQTRGMQKSTKSAIVIMAIWKKSSDMVIPL